MKKTNQQNTSISKVFGTLFYFLFCTELLGAFGMCVSGVIDQSWRFEDVGWYAANRVQSLAG